MAAIVSLNNGGQGMVAVDHATPSMVGWCNVQWCEPTVERSPLCLATMEARVWWLQTMPHHQWCDGAMCNGVSTLCIVHITGMQTHVQWREHTVHSARHRFVNPCRYVGMG